MVVQKLVGEAVKGLVDRNQVVDTLHPVGLGFGAGQWRQQHGKNGDYAQR